MLILGQVRKGIKVGICRVRIPAGARNRRKANVKYEETRHANKPTRSHFSIILTSLKVLNVYNQRYSKRVIILSLSFSNFKKVKYFSCYRFSINVWNSWRSQNIPPYFFTFEATPCILTLQGISNHYST